MMSFLESIEWQLLLGTTPWEIVATVSAVAGVILIARQNILGWPLGLVWAGISAWLAFKWNLVSDGILYASGIPVQLYCWIVWHRRGAATAAAAAQEHFLPTWLPPGRQVLLAAAAVLSVLLWGTGISAAAERLDWLPRPDLLWRDSITTVLNYFAQFLQARKHMENWVGWILVNIIAIHIYWVKGVPIYSIQYAFFLVLGIYGWIQWQRHAKRLIVP